MPYRVITPEIYDRLLAAYREEPGVAARAARMAGCGPRLARRAWAKGWPRIKWAEPIQGVIQREQEEARVAAAKQQVAERERREELRAAAREEAVKVRTEESRVVQMARRNAIAVMAVNGPLLVGMAKLAADVRPLLENPEEARKDPEKAVRMIERLSRSTKQANEAARVAVEMERLVHGRPDDALGLHDVDGLGADQMSREEALAEIEKASADAQRALRIIDGGRSNDPPPPPPAASSKAG